MVELFSFFVGERVLPLQFSLQLGNLPVFAMRKPMPAELSHQPIRQTCLIPGNCMNINGLLAYSVGGGGLLHQPELLCYDFTDILGT
jgi:hypothetical protein